MAAQVLRCVGCDGEFVALRSDRRWCSDACRVATSRRKAAPLVWPSDYERAEAAIVRQVSARLTNPEDALLRIVRAWPASVAA